MQAESELLPRRHGRRWRGYLAVGLILLALGLFLFPWTASACFVEQAGRHLDLNSPAGDQAAGQALQRALRLFPGNAQAYRLLAVLHERQGDRPAMAEALARYLALRPRNPLGHWQLASACERVSASELKGIAGQPCGDDEAGRQAALVRLWRGAGQSAASFVQAGDRQQRDRNWAEAEVFYRRALTLDPQAATAWYGLGELYRAQGEAERALEAYSQAVALTSDSRLAASAHARRGRLLAEAGRWAEAGAALAQAVALVPDEGQYHLDYGWYLFKAGGHNQEAEAELRRAADLLPGNPWPYLRLADLAYAREDYAAMLDLAQHAVRLQPGQFWAWFSQGRALRRLNRLDEAGQALRHAIELAADQPGPHAELGGIFRQQGRLDEAIAEYEQAVALAPQNVAYRLGLAAAYRADGQTAQAIETYRRVLELDPENSVALQALRDLEPGK